MPRFSSFSIKQGLERLLPSGRSQQKRVRATASDVSPATKKREVQGRDQKDMWGLGSEPMEFPCCSHQNFAGIHGCPRRTGIDNFIAIDP